MNKPRLARRTIAGWALLGVVIGVLVQVDQLQDLDWDFAATLRLGDESAARSLIVTELGSVPVTRGVGHDGQYFYLVARDPWAVKGYGDLTNDGGYRFRRPLSGWLAGGFGLFPPRVTLVGLTVWAILGLALATAATADVLTNLGGRMWGLAGALANLGLWVSVQLVTADALATGLAMLAVSLSLRKRHGWAAIALAGAALAKEVFFLFAVGLAVSEWLGRNRRAAALYLIAPVVPLVAWFVWVDIQVGGVLSTHANFGLPFAGLTQSFGAWATPSSVAQACFALASLVIGAFGAFLSRERVLVWLTTPWLVVAFLSSAAVWGAGNNAVRAFAPIWLLGWVGIAVFAGKRQATQSAS